MTSLAKALRELAAFERRAERLQTRDARLDVYIAQLEVLIQKAKEQR